MVNCEECFHYEACRKFIDEVDTCDHFLDKDLVTVNVTEKQWTEAFNYLNLMITEYVLTGSAGSFALNSFLIPMRKRYDSGDRSYKLYKEIMAIE